MSAPDHSGFAPHTLTVKSDIFSHVEHVIRLAGNKRYKALAAAQKPLGARAQKLAPGSYHPEHIQGNLRLSQCWAFDAMTFEIAMDSRVITACALARQRFFTNSGLPIY